MPPLYEESFYPFVTCHREGSEGRFSPQRCGFRRCDNTGRYRHFVTLKREKVLTNSTGRGKMKSERR